MASATSSCSVSTSLKSRLYESPHKCWSRRASISSAVIRTRSPARRDQHLWGDSYNRDLSDVLTLQDEVAEAISNHIGSVLGGTTPQPARKIDPQAYDAYLRGLYYWNKRTSDDVNKALGYFQDAIKRESR